MVVSSRLRRVSFASIPFLKLRMRSATRAAEEETLVAIAYVLSSCGGADSSGGACVSDVLLIWVSVECVTY